MSKPCMMMKGNCGKHETSFLEKHRILSVISARQKTHTHQDGDEEKQHEKREEECHYKLLYRTAIFV